MTNFKKHARLNNWTIGRVGDETQISLFGEVYDHPSFEDGCAIVTSQIKYVDLINNIAETNFTTYRLGDRSDVVLKRYKKAHNENLQQIIQSDRSLHPASDG